MNVNSNSFSGIDGIIDVNDSANNGIHVIVTKTVHTESDKDSDSDRTININDNCSDSNGIIDVDDSDSNVNQCNFDKDGAYQQQ